MTDAETTARLRERLASARMSLGAQVEAEKWDEVAATARDLARMERELALAGKPTPPTNIVGRRVNVRG